MRRQAARAALAALVLVACNGDDAGPATVSPSTGTAAPITADETTTTTSSTSTSTSTSTTAPEETTTTVAPTTSPEATSDTTTPTTSDPDVDAAVQARIDVLEAVEASFQASLDAVRDPENDQKLATLDAYFVDPLLQGWRNIVERYRANGQLERVNLDEPDSFEIELASLAVNNALTAATVQGCSVTSGIIVEVGGNADGSDLVVEDGVARTVVELEVVRDGGVWKVASGREPSVDERIAACS